MSVPTIVVNPSNVPTSFQIATPFSFSFCNSGAYSPPPIVNTPVYTPAPSPWVLLNSGSYSPENVLLSNGSTSTGINALSSKTVWTPQSNISNGSIFAFQLPYPANGLSNSGTMQFFPEAQFSLSNNAGNQGLGQWQVRLGSNLWYGYDSNDYIKHVWTTTYNGFDITLVRASRGDVSMGFQSASTIQFLLCNVTWATTNSPVSFTITAPDRITPQRSAIPYMVVSSLTSPELLPFLNGSGGTQVQFSSTTGFQSIPSSNLTLWIDQTYNGSVLHSNVTSNIVVNPITITVTPTLANPLTISTYNPFSYVYSIPSDVVNVVLQSNSNTTSASLAQYLSSGPTTFSSETGFTTSGFTFLEIDAVLAGTSIIASNTTTINTIAAGVTATPAIPTGSLNLYKYEPFSYVFTIAPGSIGLTLQFTNSSSELQSFTTLSADQSTVTFAGTFQVSYSSVLSLVIDLLYGTDIVGTTTILVSVGTGRFFPPAANQNFQLYQYENISNTFGSNPSFLTVLGIDSIISTPGLPSGLSFGGSCNTFYLQGTPALQTTQSNYQIIGSNSTSGKIVTTTISIKVNPQTVRITPSVTTLTGLTVGTAISPVTITAIQPNTIYSHVFQYGWTGLPDGFSFQDINGNPFPQSGSPTDAALTIVLVGTPTLAFAGLMSTSGANLYQTRLTGYQTDQTGTRTTGNALINFSMAETVLINVSNAVPLYQFKPLGATDVVITAGSYFPTSTISSITADDLPPGLSLVQYLSAGSYHLVGTPTVVNLTGSYTFTATNFNGNSRSITVTIPVNPDVVTFVSPSPVVDTVINFIVSRPLTSAKTGYYTTPIQFTATSSAAGTPVTYSSSINFATYGLALNSTTGALTGIPTVALGQTSVTIYATDIFGTVGTTTILLTILADVFTWPTYSPTYFQNRAITPFQFVMVDTLSGRSIQSYSSTNLPAGLVLNPSGLLSGIITVATSGTFSVIATTGYTILSQPYSYTINPDSLLILETNGSQSFTNTFSNIPFQSISYSTDDLVNATYSISNLLPKQATPGPTLTITSGGLLSGNFSSALVKTFNADLIATYGNVTSTAKVTVALSAIPTPSFLFASVLSPNSLGSKLYTTANCVFEGTIAGSLTSNDQTWTSIAIDSVPTGSPQPPFFNASNTTDLSILGSNIISVGGNLVKRGTANSSFTSVTWATVSGIGMNPVNNQYIAVANNGTSKWVIVQSYGTAPAAVGRLGTNYSTNGGVTWQSGSDSSCYLYGGPATMVYMSPNFILGTQSSNGLGTYHLAYIADSNITGSTINWTPTATNPGFSNINRLATSNTTIVVAGSGATAGTPLARSTDGGVTWTQITLTSGGSLVVSGGTSPNVRDILFANGTWVMCGTDNVNSNFIAYSADLLSWTKYTAAAIVPYVTWTAIAFNRNAWTIAGVTSRYVSTLLSLDAGDWPTQNYLVSQGTLFTETPDDVPFFTRLLSVSAPTPTSVTGSVFLPTSATALTFTTPSPTALTLFQYVPYSIPILATGTSAFIYYYATGIPLGFTFTPSDTGVSALLSGISPSNNTTKTMTVYAKTINGAPTFTTISLHTILPYFVNPQSGAGAYTEQLRIAVEANAAQNARDNKVFPQVDPLAGPFMGPRAPDVVTPDDCVLKLCKKPCPNCHTMM